MKARLISLFLVLCLIFALAAPAAAAQEQSTDAAPLSAKLDPGSIDAARDAMNKALTELSVSTEDDLTAIVNAFSGFFSVVSSITSVFGMANTTMTFLKMIGLVKDGNAEAMASIVFQLQDVRDSLADMQRKLDNITDSMNKMDASTKFRDRAQDAILYSGAWGDFSYRYMEDGLDDYMTQYNGMLLDGLRSWCRNQNGSRQADGVDNTQIVLLYRPEGDSWELMLTTENGIPEDFPDGGRWLIIPAEALPESLTWNVDTYRAQLESYIAGKLGELAAEGGLSCENFPDFADGTPSEEALLQAARDAADVLTYRIASVEVDKDPTFALQVRRMFLNYCSHLVSDKGDDGLRALLNTFFLTHAFEFEIKNDLQTICNEMILKTGAYGTFVTSVTGMSGSLTEDEKISTLATLCTVLEKLNDLKNGCFTGYDNYCYLTNTDIRISRVILSQSGQIKTDQDGSVDGYLSYSMSPTSVNFMDADLSTGNLVGDADALLILYTLQSNGQTLDSDYAQQHLFETGVRNLGRVLTSLVTDENLDINSGTTLVTTKVIGDFFSTGSNVRLNNLPGDASTNEIKYHRKSSGSFIDLSTGALATGRTLLATAVYGESHWYWWNDEAAFFGGPADDAQRTSRFETICTKSTGVRRYDHNYSQQTIYNCLVSRPLTRPLSSLLNDYVNTCFVKDTVYEWDEGTVTKEPTCTEPGIILYRALNDSHAIREEVIEPLGHDWDEGVVTKEPGEQEKGIMTFTCLHDPDHIYTETIDATGTPTGDAGISTDGVTAHISGYYDGLYVRISLELSLNGESGLFITQGAVSPDDTVVIPDFRVPGLTVKAVNVALVRSLADITAPDPDVVSSDFYIFE